MMELTLFISKQEFETFTGVEAATPKYFHAAAAQAHLEQLTSITGKPLFDAACEDLAVLGSDLLYYVKMFLLMQTAANFARITSSKLSNMGVAANQDTNNTPSEAREIRTIQNWQARADSYARQIQRYILKHYGSYSVYITEAERVGMRANLHSAATCGVWLGGARKKFL